MMKLLCNYRSIIMEKLNAIFFACLLYTLSGTAWTQFYPDSLANWCLFNGASPNGYYVGMQMLTEPDTIIDGMIYKRIARPFSIGGSPSSYRYYVRSEADGKGYAYVPALGMEYLTGDLSVSVGDTLHDILMVDETLTCTYLLSNDWNFVLADIIIQSIDTITNSGVTVIRHSVWPLCDGTFHTLFWQAGIGTEHGPILTLTPGLAHLDLHHASVGDTCYYNYSTLPSGLPGGPACCVVIPNEVGESSVEPSSIHIGPNPSAGIFTTEITELKGSAPYHFTVLDALGRSVFSTTTNSTRIVTDLSGHVGIFFVVVESEGSRWTSRLIIE